MTTAAAKKPAIPQDAMPTAKPSPLASAQLAVFTIVALAVLVGLLVLGR